MAYSQGSVATGIDGNALKSTCLFTGITAATGVPTTSAQGVKVYPNPNTLNAETGACWSAVSGVEATITVVGTIASGTGSTTLRMWGFRQSYNNNAGAWVPIGTGGDTTKGFLNGGAQIGTGLVNLTFLHAEPMLMPGHFDRLFLEVVTLTGTTPSLEAWITVPRPPVR